MRPAHGSLQPLIQGMSGNTLQSLLTRLNNAYISYYDAAAQALKFATNASGSWVASTVDSGNVGQYTSIAIDSTQRAYISYYDAAAQALKYATNASDSWVPETVDSTGDIGQYTSIAIDSAQKAYISYYDAAAQALKYATNASGSWVASTVDSGNVGQYTSIAIDSINKAYISYYDAAAQALKYATNASGSWVASTVDSGNVGQYTSIAIDSGQQCLHQLLRRRCASPQICDQMRPAHGSLQPLIQGMSGNTLQSLLTRYNNAYISYYDAAAQALKYATNASGSWVASTVDSGKCRAIHLDRY